MENLTGMKYYEPAQTFCAFDGENFLDHNGLTLTHPNDFSYEDGFISI